MSISNSNAANNTKSIRKEKQCVLIHTDGELIKALTNKVLETWVVQSASVSELEGLKTTLPEFLDLVVLLMLVENTIYDNIQPSPLIQLQRRQLGMARYTPWLQGKM